MGKRAKFEFLAMIQNRQPNRLKKYDYSKEGFYFVTICTKNRENFFGHIENQTVILNEYGNIIKMCWFDLPNHYQNCILNEFIIMPNHIHGIIVIDNVGTGLKPVLTNPVPNSVVKHKNHGLSEIVRGFKTFSSRKINHLLKNKKFQWQRSFYDHIIRNEKALLKIRQYIAQNPLKWDLDIENINQIRDNMAQISIINHAIRYRRNRIWLCSYKTLLIN